jgi:hypothetical protein
MIEKIKLANWEPNKRNQLIIFSIHCTYITYDHGCNW